MGCPPPAPAHVLTSNPSLWASIIFSFLVYVTGQVIDFLRDPCHSGFSEAHVWVQVGPPETGHHLLLPFQLLLLPPGLGCLVWVCTHPGSGYASPVALGKSPASLSLSFFRDENNDCICRYLKVRQIHRSECQQGEDLGSPPQPGSHCGKKGRLRSGSTSHREEPAPFGVTCRKAIAWVIPGVEFSSETELVGGARGWVHKGWD